MAVNESLEAYAHQLVVTFELRESTLRSVIQALDFTEGTCGLDVGCGAGLQSMLLAEAVGRAGQVTGVDVEPKFLEHGQGLIEEAGFSGRVVLREGNANQLPFADASFDWAWSVDCVGYGPWDPDPQLREMSRVVRPGGTVAIIAWSSEKLLPGYPLLEAKLQATTDGIRPFETAMPPARHFPRALGLLREVGLVDLRAQTFAGTAHASLSENLRAGLESLFAMRWPNVEDELEVEHLAEFRRLCQPGSPSFILDHPDYCAFFTYSMFRGSVVG